MSFSPGAQNFDVIRLSTYRTACKLRFVQKRCNRKSSLHVIYFKIPFCNIQSHFGIWNIFIWKQQSISIPYFQWSLWCAFPVVVHLVDVWNMIEAFRDNGLSTLDHNAEINVSRLETILSSIFYQLNKRLPTTHQINVDQSIGLLLNFIVATYDRCVVSEGDLFFSQGVPYGSMFL